MVAGVIVWVSKKNLPALFRDRTASIQKAMQEARKASEDANRRLSEIEARLSRLDVEIGQMAAAAEKEAAAEEDRIKAAAEEDARKIVESADQEIAAAARAARRELTAYAADLAVSLAAKQIKVDTTTDQMLVRNFADELSATSNGSGPKSNDGRQYRMASVTNTYGRAFADVVFDQQINAGMALIEVQAIAQLVAASKPLREVWEATSIPAEQKRKLLDAIVASERVSRPVRNFFAVVIDHRRIKFLQSIVQQLERELNQRMGFTEAQITSARELSEPERRAPSTRVEEPSSQEGRARPAPDRPRLAGAASGVSCASCCGS